MTYPNQDMHELIIKFSNLSTNLNRLIRQGKESEFSNEINNLTYLLEDIIAILPNESQEHAKKLLVIMLKAYERMDYLFYADILMFELMPLVSNIKN